MMAQSFCFSKEVSLLVTYLEEGKFVRTALSKLLALEVSLVVLQAHNVKAIVSRYQFEGDAQDLAQKIVSRIDGMEEKIGLPAHLQTAGVENFGDKEKHEAEVNSDDERFITKRHATEDSTEGPMPKKIRLGSVEHFSIVNRQKSSEMLVESSETVPEYESELESFFRQKVVEDFRRAAVYPKPRDSSWMAHYKRLFDLQKNALEQLEKKNQICSPESQDDE